MSHKTYEQAWRHGDSDVWPGCGNGRCRPCGRIHDFGRMVQTGKYKRVWVPRFQCHTNAMQGCPQPHPGGCVLKSEKHRTCAVCRKELWKNEREAALARWRSFLAVVGKAPKKITAEAIQTALTGAEDAGEDDAKRGSGGQGEAP